MKALIIIFLTVAIFGGAAYSTWRLYVKPHEELVAEKARGPAPPPPDPTLPEFDKRLVAQDSQSLLDARQSWSEFIDHYPESSKISEAKGYLGKLNSAIFLSPIQSPEKEVYIVKSGDVITRVATKMKTTPELLMKSNNMTGSMLRIGQKIVISPSEFTITINRRQQKVVLLNQGKFFKQYDIIGTAQRHSAAATPSGKAAAPTPRPPKVAGKIADRVAWFNGQRVTYADKDFFHADHWIVVSPAGHTIYADHPADAGTVVQKPPSGGYAVAPEDARELAALLKKNDTVTID